jgi:hypothetical protein
MILGITLEAAIDFSSFLALDEEELEDVMPLFSIENCGSPAAFDPEK